MGQKLTRRTLELWLKSPNGGAWLWCGELRGFGVHRRANGRAKFVVQFRVGHGRSAKRRRVVLGDYPTTTPEEARGRAADHIRAGWKGNDAVASERAIQAAQALQRDTVGTLADSFHAARRTHLKGRSADQYESLWRRLILPVLGSKAVTSVKRSEVANMMDQIERSARSSVADRVHEQMAIFFRWYAERNDDFRSPLVRTIKRHRKGTGARPMADGELQRFWHACGEAGIAGAAGRLCLLTATRRTETTAAAWSEISGDGIWTIPSNRYKTKHDHIVPLSQAAVNAISRLERVSPFLFSLTQCPPDSWSLWTTIVDAGGPTGEGLSWHSLRKTARTLMSRSGVRSEYAERALGHVQGAVERAYDKHEYLIEKRTALAALAMEVDRVVNEVEHATVVKLNFAA